MLLDALTSTADSLLKRVLELRNHCLDYVGWYRCVRMDFGFVFTTRINIFCLLVGLVVVSWAAGALSTGTFVVYLFCKIFLIGEAIKACKVYM